MRKLWITAVAGLALAAFMAQAAQAAVIKANYTVSQDQPSKRKAPQRRVVVTPVCVNFFQCLFGSARRPGPGSNFGQYSRSNFSGGISDRVTRATVSFDEAKYKP